MIKIILQFIVALIIVTWIPISVFFIFLHWTFTIHGHSIWQVLFVGASRGLIRRNSIQFN